MLYTEVVTDGVFCILGCIYTVGQGLKNLKEEKERLCLDPWVEVQVIEAQGGQCGMFCPVQNYFRREDKRSVTVQGVEGCAVLVGMLSW